MGLLGTTEKAHESPDLNIRDRFAQGAGISRISRGARISRVSRRDWPRNCAPPRAPWISAIDRKIEATLVRALETTSRDRA